MDPDADPPGSPVAQRRALQNLIKTLQHTISSVAECPKPVIAAVHGYCVGAGVDLITACDIRYAAANTTFSIRETRLAMVADVGTLQRLPRIIDPAALPSSPTPVATSMLEKQRRSAWLGRSYPMPTQRSRRLWRPPSSSQRILRLRCKAPKPCSVPVMGALSTKPSTTSRCGTPPTCSRTTSARRLPPSSRSANPSSKAIRKPSALRRRYNVFPPLPRGRPIPLRWNRVEHPERRSEQPLRRSLGGLLHLALVASHVIQPEEVHCVRRCISLSQHLCPGHHLRKRDRSRRRPGNMGHRRRWQAVPRLRMRHCRHQPRPSPAGGRSRRARAGRQAMARRRYLPLRLDRDRGGEDRRGIPGRDRSGAVHELRRRVRRGSGEAGQEDLRPAGNHRVPGWIPRTDHGIRQFTRRPRRSTARAITRWSLRCSSPRSRIRIAGECRKRKPMRIRSTSCG